MLVRLRSTSIALLSLVTAIGLGLVAFVSQLGWPAAVNSPIPGGPAEAGSVRDAIALTRPDQNPAPSTGGVSSGQVHVSRPANGGGDPASDASPTLGGSRQISVSPGTQAPSATPLEPTSTQPGSAPNSEPVSQPPASPPTPSLPSPSSPSAPVTAVVEPSAPSPAVPSKDQPIGKPKQYDPASVKAKNDADGKTAPSSPETSGSHGYWKGKDYSVPPVLPSSPTNKPELQGYVPPAVTTPPSAAYPSKDDSAVSGYDAGKGARDAGKSDGSHH